MTETSIDSRWPTRRRITIHDHADLDITLDAAVSCYVEEVADNSYPDDEHSYA